MTQFDEYNTVKLLNVPHAFEVGEEVILHDCYRIKSLPGNAIVIDIGGFYGEYGILAHRQGAKFVAVFEPSSVNYAIMQAHVMLNDLDGRCDFMTFETAVVDYDGVIKFRHDLEHPAGSSISGFGYPVDCADISGILNNFGARFEFDPIVVKIDAEGAEERIFQNLEWLERVEYLTMEFHNYDGQKYADILHNAGFTVELEGAGPPPRPTWNESIQGGLLHAKR